MYYNDPNGVTNQLSQMLMQGTTPTQARHVTKVNGRAGADNYQLPPNSDDILLDMNEPIIYFVQSDGAGYKTVTSYDISLHKDVNPQDQYKALEDRILKLEEEVRNGKPNYRSNDQRSKSERNDAGNRSNDKG